MKNDIHTAFHEIILLRDLEPGCHNVHAFREHHYEDTLESIQAMDTQQKKYFFIGGQSVSKAAVMIAILILISSITIYAMYSGLTFEVFDINTDIRYIGEKNTGETMKIYLPTYLPEGYRFDATIAENNICTTTFIHSDGAVIEIIQQSDATYNVDSEDTQYQHVSVLDSVGYYFEKRGDSTLVWTYNGSMFELFGNPAISCEESIRVAESIKIKEEN